MKFHRISSSYHFPRVLFILAFCSGMILSQAAAWGQSGRRNAPDTSTRSYMIRGAVRSAANDQILQMVRVDLTRFTGETINTAFTRSNGDFEFNGLGPGEYFIDVKHEGFEPMREKVEIMNSSRVGIYLFLKPIGETRLVSKDPAVSARDLAIPRKAFDAFNKGMEQLARKNSPEGSLQHFNKALESLSSYYEAHHMRAVAYLQLGRNQEAEKDFRSAIEKSANKYADPYFGLASMGTIAKQFEEAAALATRGLAIDTNAWRGYYELARAQAGLNQFDLAAKSIDQARQLKQDFPDIFLVSANINMRRQDTPSLLRDLDEFLKLQPEGAMADQARKMRESIRVRMAAAQAQPGTPPPDKKPQ